MSSHIRRFFQHPLVVPASQAFQMYWPAILFIQTCALGVVISYYKVEGALSVFDRIEVWKQSGGYLLPAITTIISGGVIPECVKRVCRPEGVTTPTKGELLHQFIMWGWLGILIDSLYKVLAHLLGNETDALTLVSKVLCDQFIFTPLLSLPLIVVWFIIYECGYRWSSIKKQLRLRNIYARVLPLWAACLTFWPIMLTLIFSMPQTLQFPLFLFGNAAYSILMIFILRRQTE